jgi:S1-C subfamily serine protease
MFEADAPPTMTDEPEPAPDLTDRLGDNTADHAADDTEPLEDRRLDPLPPSYDDGGAGWIPPWQPSGADGPASPPARRAVATLAIAALALTSGGIGVAIGLAVHRGGTRSPSTASFGTTPGPSIFGNGGNGGIGGSGDDGLGGGHAGAAAPATGGGTLNAAAVAGKVNPAVVDITSTLTGQGVAAGTGMVLTSSGQVLTNNHVIDGATNIQVQVDGNGPTYSATVVGYDVTDDVALLQLKNASGLKTITTADSSKVKVGQPVVASGNALGRSGPPTVTQGQVTAVNQTITAGDFGSNGETLSGLIQIDAPIQPGDSGGPLIDASGHVIGMNTAASASRRRFSASNVAFAIPINAALDVVKQIRTGQSTTKVHVGPRGILGVAVEDPQGGFGGSSQSGAVVSGVESGSPAESAGLTSGDVIVAVDGTSISSAADLSTQLGHNRPGDRVTVTWVDSAGNRHHATITLVAGPPA